MILHFKGDTVNQFFYSYLYFISQYTSELTVTRQLKREQCTPNACEYGGNLQPRGVPLQVNKNWFSFPLLGMPIQ